MNPFAVVANVPFAATTDIVRRCLAVHLTRHGRRVAAVVPEQMAETADDEVRALSKRFADKHRNLLDRLAE